MNVVVFGSANIDHVYAVRRTVRFGETMDSEGYETHEGGKGFNQAVALQKAGLSVRFAGAVGADGARLRESLERCGVDTGLLETADVPTGHAIIQVDEEGQNAILLFGGANRAITKKRICAVLDTLAAGDVVVMQNEISHVEFLLRESARRGIRAALNPSPITPELLRWPLDLARWLILNEIEGEALTGETEPGAMLEALARRCPRTETVLTLGEAGARYACGDVRLFQEAFPTKAVDTTGAGDTFMGYFLAERIWGEGAETALWRAAKAAAIAVSRPGAAESIPRWEEMEGRGAGMTLYKT